MSKNIYVNNFICGNWDCSTTNDRFQKIDPISGKELAQVTESTDIDILKTVESAAIFHRSRTWVDMSIEGMDEIFSKINALLQERRDELANALVSETGKSKKGAHDEVGKAIETFKAIQYQKYQTVGDTLPSQDNGAHIFTTRYPVGVTAVITPWNFPVYIGAQHLAPALMARNTVILKCSPHTPISSSKLIEILLESGLPPKMISLIHGTRTEVIGTLVSDKRVDMVSFTGSSEIAKEIAIKRGGRKFILEGGGNNFQVVLADSDITSASENAVKGAMAFSGQKCVATGNVLVEEAIINDFLEKIKAIVEKMKTGDVNAGADIGPLVGERCDNLEKLITESITHGGKLITGGTRIHPKSTNGSFFTPTVLVLTKDNPLVKKELFAPVLKIIPIKNLDEAIDVINEQEYGLAASIFSKKYRDIIKFVHQVQTGLVNVNSATGGSEAHMPFGGGKLSGNGFRLGNPHEALRAFSEIKTVKWYPD